MKILQIIDTLSVGGAEKILVTLANLQLKYGDEVAVLTFLSSGELARELNPSIPVRSLERKWKFNPIVMYRYIKMARNFDIIHVHSAHNLRYTYFAFKLFGVNKQILFHEHFGDIETNTSVKWHQKLIYPKIYFVGVSKKLCGWAKSKIGVQEDRVFLLPNIVACHPLISREKTKKMAPIKIVMIGNIRRAKNIEFGIRLMAKLVQDVSATLTVIGKITDRQYFFELQAEISTLGLEDAISFDHNCSNVQPILSNFDIAIHPAHSESGPLVLIEYLAQGIPFLSNNVGEVTQIVKMSFPEFILDQLEVEVWKQTLLELEKLREDTTSRKLRQFYEANFSEKTYYQKCRSIYEKVLHS